VNAPDIWVAIVFIHYGHNKKINNIRTMPLPEPLPPAANAFHAGMMSRVKLQYPHLPKSPVIKMHKVMYPSLSTTGQKSPSTKMPMGYTQPILTAPGRHRCDY
jgi:hypothetical protein